MLEAPLLERGIDLLERRQHFPGRKHRLLGMIRHLDRCAPECHDRIADVFIDRTFMSQDDLGHDRKVHIQHLHDLFRRRGL